MKKVLSCLMLGVLLSQFNRAQVSIYTQNFEGPVVANLVNSGDATLTSGPSPCSKASYGDTADFNSSMVNFFDGVENLTQFMAVNPQSPCGGFYDATVYSDTFDLTGLDSAYFNCHYFKGNGLGWGPVYCRVIISNGTVNDTILSEFSSIGSWDMVSKKLKAGLIGPNVRFNIYLGGGDGVGIDDVMVEGFGASSVEEPTDLACKLFPNPASEVVQIKLSKGFVNTIQLMDLSGKQVYIGNGFNASAVTLPVNHLNAGIYLVKVTDNLGHQFQHRIIVTNK